MPALADPALRPSDADIPPGACLHELFAAQAARTPGAAALVFEDETLSYAELNARANRLAHHLRVLGVGPETRVGICAERSLEMVVGVLGVLKAGGAYVPLDPGYPAERLAYMLADSAPAAVLVQTHLRDRVESADVPMVELDAAAPGWASLPATDPGRGGLTPDHLAYVIYTSGSTGRPKGVRVSHGSLGATLAVSGEAFGFGAGDRVPSLASFAFDIWLFETLLPLLGGGTVRLVPRERVPDVPRLVEDLARCTALHAVPALMRRIVEEVRATPEGVLGTLRHAFVGGDAVAPDLLEEMRIAFPAAEIHVLYGPTEAAIICAAHRLGGEAAARQMVGRPLGNAALHVVEPGGTVAPVGVAGELCLGGASVARDYLGRPGLTAERFVPDPFSAQPGARLYRTGDRVRWVEVRERESAKVRKSDGDDDSHDADSTLALSHSRTFALEFLGRTDHQVKVRGFRIEPGEIEARLAEHLGVRAPVVLAREDAPGDRRLVAYYLADEPVAVDALKSHLAERLPEYMVPAAYVWMQKYPLTPNGKLDRNALPAPGGDAYAAREYEAPVGETEQALAAIWAEVLGAERVGGRDHFFDLGGHSLLATRVVSRIREVLAVDLPLRALFDAPTLAELAARIDLERRAGEGAALPPLVPVAREAPLPLSFAQERLWFLHQMEPGDVGYNGPWPSRLRGSLDASALERALGELVSRHEALRTTFHPVEQGAVQVVHPAAPAHLPVLDLTGLAPEDREDEARRLAREDAERPFDLERGPLLRATLMRLSDEEHVLLLTMHHIVSDDWSMGVLFRELLTLYESLSGSSGAARPASPLPPLAVQYADFAVWQRGWLQGEVLRREIDWWRERLGGAPPALELPTDRRRPAVASSRGAAHVFRIPAEITRGLRSLARREGATLYMVTHAAFDLLLSRWSGEEDMVVGSPIAGRTQVGTEGLIGFFVNTLALRIDLSGDPSFQELMGRVRETALGAYAHQELPFERLVEEVAPERGLSHTPLFQVMFALQNADTGAGSAIAGLRLEPFGSEVRTVRFDLELDLTEEGEELVASLRFRTDLFDAAIMERFAAQYRAVLAAAVASPEERLSRLAILPEEEVRQIVAFGGGSARDGTGDAPVHLLFAEQAARTPNMPALLFAGESLTYAELDARAERLARRLRGRTAPGATIAVCLERGPAAVVALLAVWKMGGVYLPLDPSHPVERLSFLLRDSGAKLVVSDLPLAGALLEREADVLLLDPSAEGDLPGGALEPRGGGGPGDLAYLIYTSGSTGTPKAVMVEHAQLTHTLRASLETLGFAPGDVVAALASTSFDISLLELVTPLLAGAAVRIVPHEVARDPETLVEAVRDVSVLHAVPALMRQVVEVARGGRMLPSLRLLLVGGDSVPPDLLEDMRELFPAAQTRVLYGPTEGTIICATYAVPAEGALAGHPLGRPLPGVRLAVGGPRGEMAPVGVPGEVWISGGGVARGYLGRPELNAEKFVGAGPERAYRTGDRARWRPDGVLEFLGRADEQVKVRGFRIEPGEVEAVLREQPGVREAVVLAREDAPGDRRLVAYVVPGAEGVDVAGGKEQVSEWETLFDDTYAQDEGEEDPTLALKGWNSSYTGEPIPREEMRAWAEHTVEPILALRPERVLEVGCGTGLLLFRVAPHTRAYHGTDFSGVALEHIRRHAVGLPQVSLAEREADRLDDYARAGFDLVVVNSVAQYFPDLGYLLRVLEGAAAALRPGGRIFVGDVRSLPLLGAFHASVELARAPEGLPVEQLQARLRRGMAEEQELLLDPALFEAVRARMPRLGRVEVQVKRGEYDNEVSRFRYDVVLHLDVAAAATAPVVREWSGEDAAGLRALAEGSASALLVRGVPDARVREHVRAYDRVWAGGEATSAAAVRVLAAQDAGGIAPEALFALAGELARGIEVRPGAPGTLDVLFHPAAGVAHFPAAVDAERPWESYANDPQWGRRMRALVPALREAARARLPEYMVPSAIVVLAAFPVTPNGKVDRAALPAPDTLGSRGGTYVAPRTPAEERMAGIWVQVLGVERVGAEDHFFDLGGHSLLATQLVSRVREAFRTELPLRAVFEAPTLGELMGRVEALRAGTPGDAGAPPLVPVPRDGSPLPLSFAQQRQWFIDQMEGAGAAYHVAWRVRLRGELDCTALARALERIVARHESLRTTFPVVQGEPEQRIAPADEHGFTLLDHDLTACADVESELRRLAVEEVAAPFDLAVGPLVRARLVRIAADDHALMLTMHHAVSDGWSVGVLVREMEVLYPAFLRGEDDPLPPLPVQYADFAVWHRRWVTGPAVEAQAEYWTRTLAGAPELLELPTDRPRPARQDFAGASVNVELDEALTAALKALSQRHGTTPFMTLLAGWAVVLARLSGQNDVVVGAPSAGRGSSEIEGLIGFFVNTLALRVELSGAPTVAELLGHVRERALEAQRNQDFPFEQVVERVRPARSLSHTPLFQVVLAWQEMTGGELKLPGIAAAPLEGVEEEAAGFDLMLSLAPRGGRIAGELTYATALFDRATVERHVGYLRRALEEMVTDDSKPVDRLELLSAAERHTVVEEWNATDAGYPASECVHDLIRAQAARTPEAAALSWQGERLTYAELEARANQISNALRRRGVGPEVRVGICLPRTPELVASMLGVLKSGGSYVPLDPAYPQERLGYMLEDAGVTLVITESSLADRLPEGAAALLLLDRDHDEIAAESAVAPESGVVPENLSHVIFTSGSTGRPKGVMIRHSSVAVLLHWLRENVSDEERSSVLFSTSINFDVSVAEVFGTLAWGGKLVIVENALELATVDEEVVYASMVPGAAAELLRSGGIPASVKTLNLGGDALPNALVQGLYALETVQKVGNLYGPTEDTTYSTYHLVPRGADQVLVGTPVANTRAYVLDAHLQPVPMGVVGELHLAGDGLSRGYANRPAMTAERFVPCPFGAPGGRMYRVMDRVRRRTDGELEYLGRTDFQVKVRGFRIELGEIEARLAEHPGLRAPVVLVREDAPGDRRLVAYYLADEPVAVDALKSHLADRLPGYMVPAAYVWMETYPLTPNGKVDRKALPEPDFASAEGRHVAPRTPTEEVLAGSWAEVLRLEGVGVTENFFDLGGHSLLATRVISRVRQVFGVELPLRAVFERSVLCELAAEIDRLRGSGAAVGADAIAPAGREGDLPVTFAQERLWFVDALDPGSPAYAIPFSYGITGPLDLDALRRALAELVRRHEPLRTTLPAVDGVPVQRIAPPPADFDLPVADLRHLPEVERRAEAERLAAEASRHRFDLARGPLFRASLVRVGDAEHRLLLDLHHAVGDGWSLGVLMEELSTLYGAFSRGEPSPLPEPALQYADYAVWQRERLSGAALEREVEFWRRALDGAPTLLELPTDRPRPPVESHRGAVERLVVPSDLTAEVHALARREGATLFMVLLSALDVVFGRLAGQEDVVVGTPIAGRTRAETDRMVGLFLNSLALRTDLSGDPSFRELLGRVRETTLSAYAHQDLPFERVLEEVHPERSLAHAPVFQVMLNLLNFQDGGFLAEGLEVAEAAGGELASKFDLTLYVGERDGGIVVDLVYAADLFDAPRMRELLAQLEGVLRQAAAAPETRVGALSLATEAARGVLPDPARPIEAEAWRGAVHERFAAHAAESPEALAISDAAERWTYAELDAAANRIAHRLIDGGVRPGDVVAVYAHRSAALVRALLGAWKAGAAFAVLDPAYPPARLAAQAGAARPAALLRISAAGEVPAEVAAALAETARTTVVLPAGGDDGLGGFPSAAPAVSVAADDLAYVAFTSGTTGAPKAIAGTHRPLAHFFGWYGRELGLSAGDRFSLLSGLAHDPLLRDVFAPLTVGGSIAIPDAGEIGTPGWLAGWMRDERITVAHLTPAMGQLLATGPGDTQLPALRLACFGGDVLRAADVERLRAAAPNAEAVNFYGATETPQAMGIFRLPADLAKVGAAVPVGRGIDGVDLLVITPSGTLAGIGERGEIAVRTPYLSRGYLNDAELTAARFVPNPLTGDPADRVYRTGDLGRYRPDGAVEPAGRADGQVKVRGFRVELGEIEAALAKHPSVGEAVVAVRGEDPDRVLVAYAVPREGAGIEAEALRAHLKSILPDYMVPAAFMAIAAVPLTANGKVDRRALPEPEAAATDSRSAAPRTPTEEILAQIWAEVLRLESVGVDDDFFALGGHSLLATRLLARVQNALGVVVPLRALFEGPTVAELAVRVEEVRRAGLPVLPPVMPVDRDRPLPLSFAQERLWFIDQLEGGSAPYNIPTALRLGGALDVDALERALGEIVHRHEALRTVFREVDGGAVQVIAPFAGFALPVDDLSGLAETARETEVRRRAREDAARPFDLAEGPLVRAALLRVSDEEHVLLLCIHHIVSDGWSSGVLLRELGVLYAAYRDGSDSPLAELPVQYADFAVWQREQLRGEALDRQVGYWKERLAGAPALLELPTDRPRPPVQSHRGARERFDLPRALLDGLQALGRSEGATLYMVMLSAFQLLLSKYSGSEDIVVGSPIAGRTRKEIEELIGFFANTLVLRTDLSADPTFRELLGRVREETLGAYEHQEVPFERLVAELQPERSLSHAPLFQVIFALQNGDRSGSGFTGLRMEGVAAEVETTRFDLGLTAVPHEGGVWGVLEYSTDLFDRSTVRRMLGHLERVLEQVAVRPEARLSQLDLLSAEERRMVVEEWNATDAAVPADACVHELFEAQVARTPDAVAVEFDAEALSYAELNARANRLAHHLRALGVGPDAPVGICVERGLEMVVGVLGVLKAGGAYVPLDPGYPAKRLAYVLSDSALAAVLVQTHLRDRIERADVPLLELDAAAPTWASLPATDPGRGGLTPDHLAYVIYTSGSTGRPKGVRVSHGSLGATLAVAGDAFAFGIGERVPSLASFAFDIWLFETLLPLLGGGTVRLVPRDRVPDVPRLVEDLAWCTAVHAVPALMRRIVEEVRARPGGVLPALRHAFVGGDAVAPDLLEEMRAAFPAAEIHVLYGPTEGAIICAAHRLGGEAAARQMVGRPLGNAALYVVEPGGTVAPVGVPGELCLGGASVARDYLGRPGLTAERFVPDPFGRAPGGRLYRTGDRVRWVEVRECESAKVRKSDGDDDSREADSTLALSHSRTFALEFLGRTDHQVKVRGFRIEPGEIEARLAEHPAVREAVVLVREDAPGEKRLVAYLAGDETAGADVLRAHLSERLPEYMVPAAYVRLETLPLTPNGKVDRRALPAPKGDGFPARGYEAPSGRAEEAVAGIWAELLGAERVGRRDHFFELGGHSLLAVRVVSRVRQALGVEASPRDVFERPVLADFARGLETAAHAEAAAIERVDRTGNVPLSFAQQRLWFLEQLGNLGSTYHILMRLRLRGDLDRGALERALERIVARHEALRTSFPTVDDEPVQRIVSVEESGFRLVEHDLRASPDAEDELRRLVSDEASAPFDLTRGPLFRGRLVRMAADDHVLLLTIHHIVSDGWSTGVLFRELAALYTAFARGEPDPLPPLPVQYADYAAWHRRWVEGPVLEAQAEYWIETLAGAPELLELPTDHPRPAKQDFSGASVNVELDEALNAALRALGQRHGATLFMTLLAGWATVLARLSGQDDVVIGTPSANRGRAEVEELIGFFVNTLPVRVDLSGAPTVAGLLDRVRARALEAQRNQDIPFEQVVERVRPTRTLAHAPLFQVMFAWQNAPGGSLELPGLALGPLDPAGSPSQASAKFDLSLTLWEDGGRIEGAVEYATALFERATVERHVGYLRRVLEEMVAQDAKPLDRLELLDEAERAVVLEEWNRTEAEYPTDQCIHELFEAQAARTPDAEALSFEGERLIYAELNARANRLAHHLRALGVGPDARVAIAVERGPEMVAGLLAILKAGGAYVPLDPAYPAERLRYMLADSAPAALVTQSSLAGTFAGYDVPVVELDAPAPAWAEGPETNPACAELRPDHLAYVIYTSGSTGRPKGVMVEHRSLVNHTAWQAGAFGIGAFDTVLQRTSISFDASVWELWTPLATGARMLILSSTAVKDPGAIGRAIEEGGVTIAQFVPTLLRAVLGALPEGASLPCRTLFCGGEPLSAALVEEARAAGVGEVVNLYGPTEATIDSTSRVCGVDGRAPAIGRPIANARIYVLDARGAPAPAGVAGELYVGGAGVARGYLGRAGLTAERFVPDPFSPVAGARMYRTGDLGRWRADGTLEFLGRTDFQVKVRGFRIELGEIEAALRSHDAVCDALVLARGDASGDRRLVAYYLADEPVAVEALRAHLAERLPEYMVPAAYVWMEEYPRTPNGKTDRGALPAPGSDAFAARGYEAPAGETEEAVAAIWADLLGAERVGRHDDFFQLGGNSLLATRLVFRIRREMDVEISVSDVFEKPELSLLAQHLLDVQLAQFDPSQIQELLALARADVG